jgi:hypothetical protein
MWRLDLKLNRLATAAGPIGTKSGAQSDELRAKNKALKRELQTKSKELAARIGEYRQRGEFDEAIAMLQSALEERSYPDRAIFEHLAEAYFATGRFDHALSAVHRLIELGDASAKTTLQLAVLQAKTGNASLARENFAKVVTAKPELHDAKFEYGCFLCGQGELAEGMALIDRAIERAPEAPRYRQSGAKRLWNAANRFWKADERTEAIACAKKASDLAPEQVTYHLTLARFCLRRGDTPGVLSGLKSAAEKLSALEIQPVDAKNLVKIATALQEGGELDAAWKLIQKVAPDDRPAQNLRCTIRYFQGDMAAARREALAYVKLLDSPMLRLPLRDLFAPCLRQAQADNREPEAAKWLWPRLNLPESARPDWLVRLRSGLLANELIRRWMLVNRERLDELDDLVEQPDWSLIAAARHDGRPVVLTGSHLGPIYVAVHYIDRLTHPMLMVAAGLIYALTLGTKPFVSTAEPHSMIQLRDALAKFGTVYLAGDGKGGSSRYPTKFLGSTVFLREGAAAIARLGKAQTFVCAARWAGHRIKLELIPGPTPEKGESRQSWNDRWFAFYMAQFENLLLAGPENIRSQSFWFVQ